MGVKQVENHHLEHYIQQIFYLKAMHTILINLGAFHDPTNKLFHSPPIWPAPPSQECGVSIAPSQSPCDPHTDTLVEHWSHRHPERPQNEATSQAPPRQTHPNGRLKEMKENIITALLLNWNAPLWYGTGKPEQRSIKKFMKITWKYIIFS